MPVTVVLSAPCPELDLVRALELRITPGLIERLTGLSEAMTQYELDAAGAWVGDIHAMLYCPIGAERMVVFSSKSEQRDSEPVPLKQLLTAVEEHSQGVPPEARTRTWYERDGRIYLDDPEWIDE